MKISLKNIVGLISAFASVFWTVLGLFLTTKNLGLTPYVFIVISFATIMYLFKTKFYSISKKNVSNSMLYKIIIILGNLFFIWFVIKLVPRGEFGDSEGKLILGAMMISIIFPLIYLFISEKK